MQTEPLRVLRLLALATRVDGCSVCVLPLRGTACALLAGGWLAVFETPGEAGNWLLGTLQRG